MEHRSKGKKTAAIAGSVAIAPFGMLPNGRSRLCGAWTLQGTRIGPARTRSTPAMKFARLRCKCWSCSLCGPRKASKYRGQIVHAVAHYRLNRMATFTLDVRKIASGVELETFLIHFEVGRASKTACRCPTCEAIQVKSIAHIRRCWSELRVYLHRKYRVAPRYISVLEFQTTTGLAHIHVAIDRFIDQGWLKESWQAVGGGQHVDIRYKDPHRAGAYISKYLSKELLLNAPAGMRRVTTSRSIRLKEAKTTHPNGTKPAAMEWVVLKGPIDRVYVLYRDAASDEMRCEGELESFVVRE